MENIKQNNNKNNNLSLDDSSSQSMSKNKVFISEENNNSNINSIFNNSNDENEIAITQKEFVPEHYRIYDDDEIYFQELENYFLSELSLNDQNSIYKQKKIIQKIQDILNLKNKAIADSKKPLNSNPFILHISQNNFSSPYLIPILLDRQIKYSLDDEDEQKEFSKIVNTDNNYNKLLELKRQFRYGEINLTTYYRLTIDLSLPFIIKKKLDETQNNQDYNKKIGFQTFFPKATNVLRLDNIHNKNWKIRRTEEKLSTNHLYFEENKAVPTVVDDVIFEGEEVNIVGFLLLPFNKPNITENLVGKPLIAKSGIIGQITEISKSENAIITLPNHNLSNDDTVYIEKSNSFPSVDGLHEKITILDENRFIVKINTLNGKSGNTGTVFSSLPIDMTEVDIDKLINKNNKNLQKYPTNSAKFYRINNEILNENDYHTFLNKVLPSVLDIFSVIPLDKANSMEDIKMLLENYNINLNDLYIDFYKPIQNIISQKITNLQNSKINENEFFLNNYKKYLDKKGIDIKERQSIIQNSIYRNEFLKHPTISKYYGLYSTINEAEDNILNRYLWITRKIDNGNLFFSFVKVQLTKNNNMSKNQIDEIEAELEILTKKNSNIIRRIENEDKKNKSAGICDNKKGLVIFKTMGELEASQKIDAFKDGEFALIETNAIPSKQPIFIWSSNFNKWQPNKFISNYADYCNFGSLKINEFDFRKVLCMDYQNQCKLIQQIRLERTQHEIQKIKKEYEEAGKYYQKKSNLSLLEKELEMAILKIQIIQNKYASIFEKENNEQLEKPSFEKSPIQELLGYIDNLADNDEIMELKFKLLMKDGLLIDKKIFSKTFKTELLCGHYQYLYDISRNMNTPKENTLQNQLISVYGDSGKANPGFITCQYCGEILMRDEYDTNEGISKITGEIRKTRDVLQTEKQQYARRQEKLIIETKELDYFRFDCSSNEYRNELIKKGMNLAQLPIAIELCSILNSLLQKMSILLRKNDFLQIIINTIQKLGSIPDYQRWRKDKLDKLKIKNPGIDFSRINEKVLEDEYKIQTRKKKIIFISAHLLITLQTATPPYDIRASVVSFSGLEGDEGITFIAKLLETTGMAVIQTPLQKEKKIQKVLEEDELREEILKALQIFRLMPEIRKRYDTKQKFIEETKKGLKISPELGIKSAKYPEVNELPEDMFQIMEKEKKEEGELYKTSVYILDRLNYLAQESIDDIYKYVESNDKLYPTEIASSCCIQPLTSTTNFDTPIIERTDGRFANNLAEINRGYEYLYDIRKQLISPWFRNKPVFNFFCGDLVALRFFRNTDLEHKRFAYFQINGDREEFDKEGRSLYTGKKRTTLLKEDHTEEEYKELIYNIMKKSFKKISDVKIEEGLKIEDLLLRANDYLETSILDLVKRMDNYLHQKPDAEYISMRIDFLKNLGILNKKEKDEMEFLEGSDTNQVEKYISRNQFAFNRARRIINMINFKFRKNFTKIANEFKRIERPIEEVSEDTEKKLNIFIEEQDDFLSNYMTKLNSVLFKLVKWDYTPGEIETILGKPPRVNMNMEIEEDKDNMSMENAVSVLIYILVNQLVEILEIDYENANLFDLDKTQIPNNLESYAKTTITQFIENIFREIEKENSIFDFTKSQFIQYKRAIYNTHFEKEAVKFNELTEGQKMLYKLGFDYKDISAKDMEQIAQLDNSINYQAQEKEDFYIMKAKEIYYNQYGEEPTDAQIEDIKEKLMKKEKVDKQEEGFGETGLGGGDYGDLDVNVFGEEDEPIIDENAFIEEEAEI